MAKLSMYARERVVALHFSGKNVTQNAGMRRNQNITISSKFIPLAISKYWQSTRREKI